MKMKVGVVLACSTIVAIASVSMTLAAHPTHNEKRHGPPEAAIEACQGLREEERVSFETPRGYKLDATCRKVNGILVAVPDNHKRKCHKPPQITRVTDFPIDTERS